MIQKLGSSAHAFTFQLPTTAPASIIIQDGSEETRSPVGVEYDFVTYVGDNADDKTHKRSSVSMAIRKVSIIFLPRPPPPILNLIKFNGKVLERNKINETSLSELIIEYLFNS